MNRESPRVSVVIINFNGRAFLEELFASLEEQSFQDFEIIFIDNGSSDGSVEFARTRCPRARILPQCQNLGFSKAGNLAAVSSGCEHLAFINTDMRMDRDWLLALVRAIDCSPDIAAVASKIRLYHHPSILNGVGGAMNLLGYTWDRGMFEDDRGQFDEPAEVIFASGGAALFRRASFLAAGGFDERFFMYHEDVDLGWRLWLLGHRIMTAPRSVVYHHFGGTTQKTSGLMWRELSGERNNMRSLLKNYGSRNVLRSFFRLVVLKQPWKRKLGQLLNFGWNLVNLPGTLRERSRIQRTRVRSDDDLSYLISQTTEIPIDLSRLNILS